MAQMIETDFLLVVVIFFGCVLGLEGFLKQDLTSPFVTLTGLAEYDCRSQRGRRVPGAADLGATHSAGRAISPPQD